MAQQAILVACGGGEANIVAWDLATATQLTLYKGNNSGPGCFCTVGRDYFAAAQANKDAVHFYAFHKDQVLQRSFAQERLTALTASRDGRLVAAGGTSGTLYLWDLPSGALLRAWPGHYKAVSALAFSETGGVLLSGGQDTVAAAWLVADVIDSAAAAAAGNWGMQGGRVEPLHTWSEHTLGVSAVALGAGEANAIAVTASLDRTVKVWQLATGALLRAAALPAGATSVALDAGEHSLYVGCADGSIVEVSLVGSSGQAAAAAAAAAGGSSSSGGGSSGLHVMEGHAKPVASLALSREGDVLVSGSEDGTVRLWDLRSRQCTRVINAPARAPVTGVLAVEWPEYLAGVGAATAAAGGRQGPKRPAPLAPLAKFEGAGGGGGAAAAAGGAGAAARAWEGSPLIIDGSCAPLGVANVPGLLAPRGAPLLADNAWGAGAAAAVPAAAPADAQAGVSSGGGEAEELRRQLAEARSAAERWKQLHGELHAALLAEQAR